MNCNQSNPGFELVSPCPFPMTIAITPRTPPELMLVRNPQWYQVLFLNVFLTKSLFMSSLEYKAQCMVINFLVLWSMYLSSSLVHFRNGPEYLTGGTAQMFIPFMRLLLLSLALRSFLVLLRYSFLIFFFFQLCLMVSTSNLPKFWFFYDLEVLILPLFLISHFSLLHDRFLNAKFHFFILAVYSYCLY